MASILELKSLSYKLPDGSVLFKAVDATFPTGLHGLVGKNASGKSTLLKIIAGIETPNIGTVCKPSNTGYLRQNIITDTKQTLAELFGLEKDLERIRRIEIGTATDQDLENVDWSVLQRFDAMKASAELSFCDGDTKLTQLSGGQAMRAALAALLCNKNDLILLDEPTNNLDSCARQKLIQQLKAYQGIALIASHDRALLMEMDTISELTSQGIIHTGGNYTLYAREKQQRLELDEQAVNQAEKHYRHIALENQKTKERQDKRNRQGKAARKKGGAPKIALDRAKNNAEKSTGRLNEKLDAASIKADGVLQTARQRLAIKTPLSVQLLSTNLPKSKHVMEARHLSGGANEIIKAFNLSLYGPERIAISGKNGSGKTTLLNLLTGRLKATKGNAEIYVSSAMLDQHVSLLDHEKTVLENFNLINPKANNNDCHAALARLGFRNEAAHKRVSALSGGEKLRAALACTIGRASPPQLLILDEPTNHLDLDAIAALEAGLNAYDGALIIVSHDEAFLEAINIDRMIEL